MSSVVDELPKKRKKKQDKVLGFATYQEAADAMYWQDSSKKGPTEQKKARKSNAGGSSKDDEAVSKLKVRVFPLLFDVHEKRSVVHLGNSGCLWRTKDVEERVRRFGHTVRTN